MMRTREDEIVLDASRYLSEMKREALTTIVPHPYEKAQRLDLIGLFGGRRPNLNRFFLAAIEEAGWIALSRGENPILSGTPDLNADKGIEFLRSHAPSIDGFRSKQVVDIAKSEVHESPQTILEMISRKLGKK